MTYEEFLNFVHSKCLYETIYDDSDGNTILIIKLLDAFSMVNKAQRGLNEQQIKQILSDSACWIGDDCSMPNLNYIVRAVEKAHGIGE